MASDGGVIVDDEPDNVIITPGLLGNPSAPVDFQCAEEILMQMVRTRSCAAAVMGSGGTPRAIEPLSSVSGDARRGANQSDDFKVKTQETAVTTVDSSPERDGKKDRRGRSESLSSALLGGVDLK